MFNRYIDGHGMSFGLEDQKAEHLNPPAPCWAFLLEFPMEKLIEHQNITRFTTLLMTETDTAKRELLQRLLTDEMVRQASHGNATNKF